MSTEELTEQQQTLIEIIQGSIPATAQEVATALGMLSFELHKMGLEWDAADEACTELIEKNGREYDSAFLAAAFDPHDPSKRVTEKVREAIAREKTWESRLEMEQAKQKVRKLKRARETLDRRLFVGQSIAKTIRSEASNIGYNNWNT
jgi:hypothetical protein